MSAENFKLPESPEQDQNYQSFFRDSNAGIFPINEHVAYQNGELIGQDTNRNKLIDLLGETEGPVFLTQVEAEEEVINVPGLDFENGLNG